MQTAEVVVSASHDEVPAVPIASGDEELVGYEAFPKRSNMVINVVHFSEDYYVFQKKKRWLI